ncbi:OadG family transporter subunit [Blautia sp. MSJ-19]|uniref:OadG family transporter subunit n=1 Tax=Blautia sp. MSJ-19 TaxID=2841517 RepID=UPI001C0EC635|nr:OadG family transporter subunit [Blautia sp. MSJ-19]MBU5481918.1 OadG family protein [Blautia sp. MSJ-19]
MNQMFKKASSVLTAVVCAASITFSGASLVLADDEIDAQTQTTIETTAEGLTETIIPLTDDQIAAYQESGDEFTENAMAAWDGVREELGDLKETGSAEIEYSGDEYTVTVPVEFEKENAEFVYVFDKNLTPTSMSVDVKYSFATTMKNAALNTLMGIGTVFVILIMLIFLISLFQFIPGSGAQQEKAKKKAAEEAASAPTPAPVAAAPVQEADNSELIAVIAAAIAASEGTSTDGFVVRSIRKINRKKR